MAAHRMQTRRRSEYVTPRDTLKVRQDKSIGKNASCKTRIKLKINGPKEKQTPRSDTKHNDVDEDIPMGNASDLACMNQQALANPSDGFLANKSRSGRTTLKINGPKRKGASTSSPKHKYSDKHTPMKNSSDLPREVVQQRIGNISNEVFANTPKSDQKITLKINGPKEKGISTSLPEHDYAGELAHHQKSVNIFNEVNANAPESSRKRRRTCQFGSHARAPQHRSAFLDTLIYDGASKRSEVLDFSLVSPTKQPSLNQSRKSLILTVRISTAAGGGSSASDSVSTSGDHGCSNQNGSVENQFRLNLPVESQSRPLGEDSDSDDEGGGKNRKIPLKSCHDVSNVSTDDSKKRKRRGSIQRGKKALQQSAWLLGVPSPFSSNEISNVNLHAKTRSPVVICSFGTSSQHIDDSDSASDAACGPTSDSASCVFSGVQSDAARGSASDCSSDFSTTDSLHISAKVPDMNHTSQDIEISKTCDSMDSSCIDESQQDYDADEERSPPRGRATSLRSLSVSREESEGRPGWRNTVLVPAHVITGEKPRHRPWVVDARPHVLEMTGRDREEGYKAFSLSTDCSSNIDSTTVEEDSSLEYRTEEMAEVPFSVHATEERADVPPLIQEIEQTADVLLVQAARPIRDTQQIQEDTEPTPDMEDLCDGSSSRRDPPPTSEADGASATSPEEIVENPARRQLAPSSQMNYGRTVFHLPLTSSVPGSVRLPPVSMTFPPGVEAWRAQNDPRLRQASNSSNESCAGSDCCIIKAFKCIVCGLPQRQIHLPPLQSAATVHLPSQTVSQEADWQDNPTGATTANATPHNRSNEASTETLELQEFEILTPGQPGDCTPSHAQKEVSSSRQVNLHHASNQ